MKTTFTFLILTFIFLSSFAQAIKQKLHGHCDQLNEASFVDVSEFLDCKNGTIHYPAIHSKQHAMWRDSNFELKQSLDSTVTEYFDNGTWVKYNLSGYSYNSKGYNTQSIHYALNEEESDMIPKYKYDFYFDDSGNVISINNSRQDELSGEWSYSSKREYAYDVDNNITSYILYGRNESNSDWDAFHKVEYVYNINGKLKEGISSSWDELTEDWELSIKDELTYDENEYLVQHTSYYWDGIDHWADFRKTEYLNDQHGNAIQLTAYNSLESGEWVYDSKEEREYHLNGFVSKVVYADFVDSTGLWVNDQRQDYMYDSHENLVESVTFYWDTISGNWLSVNKAELSYNLNFLIEDLLLPASWPEFGMYYNIIPLYTNMITEINYFVKNDTSWKIEDRETYHYSERDISDISVAAIDGTRIFPNPATNFIQVQPTLDQPALVEIYDLSGQKLTVQEIGKNKRIDLTRLSSGIYICRIRQGEFVTNQKIIIR